MGFTYFFPTKVFFIGCQAYIKPDLDNLNQCLQEGASLTVPLSAGSPPSCFRLDKRLSIINPLCSACVEMCCNRPTHYYCSINFIYFFLFVMFFVCQYIYRQADIFMKKIVQKSDNESNCLLAAQPCNHDDMSTIRMTTMLCMTTNSLYRD